MTGSPFDLIDTESWPAIRGRIIVERAQRMTGLLHTQTLAAMRYNQGFIECIDWVLEEAMPKPPKLENEDDE